MAVKSASLRTVSEIDSQFDVLTNVSTSLLLLYTVPSDVLYADVTIFSHNSTGVTTFLHVSLSATANGLFGATTNLATNNGATNLLPRLYPGDTIHVRTNTGTGYRAGFIAELAYGQVL